MNPMSILSQYTCKAHVHVHALHTCIYVGRYVGFKAGHPGVPCYNNMFVCLGQLRGLPFFLHKLVLSTCISMYVHCYRTHRHDQHYTHVQCHVCLWHVPFKCD